MENACSNGHILLILEAWCLLFNRLSRYSGFPLIGNLPISSNETVVLDYPINIMRIYSCRYSPGFTPGSLASGYVIARLLIPLQR
ncbi:hypothetical protein BVU_3109 [Phocaeicola vulgatus ATCC 8482]|uniref:Uncharacterized protein n=1 Tax=Phocaeicola vulgatus (strain ATCC 8482 / DSM 1447 / JCM 5826 / CCUG 4940 / NBRC 14291 / NCTC 11154) TaxID=435590 RepID=A6L4X9_PHOV8|nr:hypothetical protein BVU_3109 [Phocaeicola vulgatus ATCC 8482]